jgi:hypothetical protein
MDNPTERCRVTDFLARACHRRVEAAFVEAREHVRQLPHVPRVCLIGGPIKGSFLGVRDLGGWSMRPFKMIRDGVDSGASTVAPGDIVWMKPEQVYGPPDWNRSN